MQNKYITFNATSNKRITINWKKLDKIGISCTDFNETDPYWKQCTISEANIIKLFENLLRKMFLRSLSDKPNLKCSQEI